MLCECDGVGMCARVEMLVTYARVEILDVLGGVGILVCPVGSESW